jgi:hypothetical protein
VCVCVYVRLCVRLCAAWGIQVPAYSQLLTPRSRTPAPRAPSTHTTEGVYVCACVLEELTLWEGGGGGERVQGGQVKVTLKQQTVFPDWGNEPLFLQLL